MILIVGVMYLGVNFKIGIFVLLRKIVSNELDFRGYIVLLVVGLTIALSGIVLHFTPDVVEYQNNLSLSGIAFGLLFTFLTIIRIFFYKKNHP